MAKRNPTNERIKLRYFEYLKQADGKAEATVRQIELAVRKFEETTGFVDLKKFDLKQAMHFKDVMAKQKLAPVTILSRVKAVKRFLHWLALQPGYKRQINQTDIQYLSLSEKDIRAASTPTEKAFPSLSMIEKMVSQMPDNTPIEKRDRAMIVLTAITGVRDGALISLKLKHLIVNKKLLEQNPLKGVKTKNSKHINSLLLPLGDGFEHLFLDWVDYLKTDELFTDNDPLFPKTAMGHDKNGFAVSGLSREHWANTTPVREIFKKAFIAAGLPVFTPHRFRDMIVSQMYERKLDVPQVKAWSQNLGHENVQTTLTSYGKLPLIEQERLIRGDNEDNRPVTMAQMKEAIGKLGL